VREHVHARVSACVHFVCAHMRVFCTSVGILAYVCVCVCVCVRHGCGFALWRYWPSHRTAGTGGINSSAGGVSSACGLRLVRRARLPQVSPGRAAPSRRNGLADVGTRRWSTPPAPSTSSAAPTAPPTSGTRGQTPTEVRDRTHAGVVGGYSGVLRGYYGVLRGS
jgi:hypothetical protein